MTLLLVNSTDLKIDSKLGKSAPVSDSAIEKSIS